MSAFIDSIQASLLTGRKPNRQHLSAKVGSKEIDYDCMYEYKIAVEWQQTGYCQPHDLKHLLENSVRALKRDVYGDLEERLIKLERAVYEADTETALSTIRDIMREISA